ncbi:MAG: alpha/beta fold hydrolase [Rhodobacteraceae bacterium]|nr:MAG: alpha/beta fold hydrolase [Paracoccaceae bacterium]
MTRRRFFGAGAAALGLGACATGAAETRHPPVGGIVRVEDLRIHYVAEGEGPTVVLIHGASGNLRDFTFSMTDALKAQGLRVVAFDRPGHGWSDRAPERGWSPAVQARVLRKAAEALGVERPVVAGHSWGGAVAMAWALDDPQGVAAAVSIAGATYPWGGDAGLIYRLARNPILTGPTRALVRAFVDPEDAGDVVARVFRPQPAPPGYAEHIGVGLALRPDSFRWNAEDLHHLNDELERQAPRYASLPMPVEAIHGAADRTVWASVHAEPLARDAPEGRLTLLDGVGHMPHHVAEAAVVERIAAAARA